MTENNATPATTAGTNGKALSTATPPKTVKGVLLSEQFKKQVELALPKHLTPERFIRVATTTLMRTPRLAECDMASFTNALLNLSQLGLEPDGRNAHLIPFKNRKRNCYEVQMIVDYKGLVALANRSGNVSNIHADVVCENDEFVYDKGEIITHKIDFSQPRGEAYAAYAIVRFKDGTEKSEVMGKFDILAIRDNSQGWKAFQKGWAKQSPWDPDNPTTEYEMWKKTAFRRCSKWIELSPEYRDLLEADGDRQAGFAAPKPIPVGLDLSPTSIPDADDDDDPDPDGEDAGSAGDPVPAGEFPDGEEIPVEEEELDGAETPPKGNKKKPGKKKAAPKKTDQQDTERDKIVNQIESLGDGAPRGMKNAFEQVGIGLVDDWQTTAPLDGLKKIRDILIDGIGRN
jgi:recombination protein RecT